MTLSAALPLLVAGLAATNAVLAERPLAKVGFGLVTVWMLGEYACERKGTCG